MPVHKRIFAAAKGFLRAGPLGAAAGFVGKQGSRPAPPRFEPRGTSLTTFAPLGNGDGDEFGPQGPDLPSTFPGTVPEPGFRGGLQRFLPGGQTGYTGAPPGYHINKAYMNYLRARQQGRAYENPFKEPRAVNVIVKNRSMNPLNPRALMRANSRQVAAVRLMRRTLRGTGYSISRSRFGAKKRARR